MADDNRLVIIINGKADDFIEELDKVKKQTASLEKVLTATAKASAAAFAGFASSIALVTKSFADYEKALVGVGKTTNIEGRNLQRFGKEFQKLSSQIPLSTNELLGIAQAAGQLGVTGEKNLLKFTDTVARLGVATDISGEEAATALTRVLNVTEEGIDTIDTFGSVIVALGNNFAATESEIVRVTTEVARSTAVFGVSSAEAAALATSLKSLGVQAQLGGSAVGRAFRTIEEVIRKGGVPLENLIRLTGMTGDELKRTFEEDATSVFQAFINGLGRINDAGGSTTAALEAFGLKGDEINKVLPVLAKNSELLASTLNTAAEETRNATALNTEAEKAFSTLSSTFQRTQNNLTNLATNIGEQLAPQITTLLESLNDIIKDVSELDENTLSLIATFLKWGAIISGIVAGVTAFALGALKLSAIITALSAAFLPATIAASGFWVAVTGPIGIAIAGIAALTAGFVGLKSILTKDEQPKSLQNINKELKEIDEQIKAIQEKRGLATSSELLDLNSLKRQREELQKLREEKIKASEDFGTGELLVRPTADGTDPLAGIDRDLGQQEIPLRTTQQIEEDTKAEQSLKESQERQIRLTTEAEAKKSEAAKREREKREKAEAEATAKRIADAKKLNSDLKGIQQARGQAENEEEKKILQRKAEIENEFREAEQIKNQEERDLALENLNLRHEQELKAIEEFENAKDERDTERNEQRRALKEELNELDKEQRDALTQEDIERLQGQVETENEILRKQALDNANRKVAERNKFVQDEKKFGTAVANLNKFFASEEVETAKSASSQLVQLSRSKNKTLKGIGKAAARVQAAIATAEGAIKAYSSLAGIPFVGPALGAAAAAAIIAFGVEQQAQISAAQTGGFVPPGGRGARDRVPALLEPGELVVPQAIAPNFIQAAGIPDTQAAEAPEAEANVFEIRLEDRAGEFITLEQREGQALGIIEEQS